MSLAGVLVLLLISSVCGMAVLISVGAVIGQAVAQTFNLPMLLVLHIDGRDFPLPVRTAGIGPGQAPGTHPVKSASKYARCYVAVTPRR